MSQQTEQLNDAKKRKWKLSLGQWNDNKQINKQNEWIRKGLNENPQMQSNIQITNYAISDKTNGIRAKFHF